MISTLFPEHVDVEIPSSVPAHERERYVKAAVFLKKVPNTGADYQRREALIALCNNSPQRIDGRLIAIDQFTAEQVARTYSNMVANLRTFVESFSQH